MLKFDEATQRTLNAAYEGADFSRRRRATFDALKIAAGDVVLDLGCGPGHLAAEMAQAVGPGGRVLAVDQNTGMLATAAARCADLPQVETVEAGADRLPFDDASVDKAASIQVFEYIEDIAPPIAEIARVLRPGGRVAIGDMHFGTWVWASDFPERMARMIESWNKHVAQRAVHERLPHALTQAGFEVEDIVTVPFTAIRLRPDELASLLIILMERYAVENGHIPAADARAWAEEQAALSDEGRFFFSIMHFVAVARRV